MADFIYLRMTNKSKLHSWKN